MNEYPMCEVPRSDWISGDPTSALTSGAVTSVSSSCGLRGHFTYTTTWGSEISGIASSEATRSAYVLPITPAPTTSQTTARHRITVLITARIIGAGWVEWFALNLAAYARHQ